MVLIVVASILVLAIAFFQIVQGLYSALVMAVLTVLCAALTFAVYPLVAGPLYTSQPAQADALAIIATFVLPLLALRILADRLIPGNAVFGIWADRIVGGVLGIFTGIIVVGMLAVSVQMLPFGESVLTYKPFDKSLQRSSALAPFYCDEFVIKMMKTLSAGSLSGKRQLGSTHQDILLEAHCARNTAGRFGRVDALPDALRSVEFYDAPELRLATWRKDIPANPMFKDTGIDKDIIVRCEVDASARDETGGGDTKQRWRLPGTHFRLVTKTGESHYPIAYLTYGEGGLAAHPAPIAKSTEESDEGMRQKAELASLIVVRPASKEMKSLLVDWVYRVPADHEPRYMVFRRVARKAPPAKGDLADKQGRMPSVFGALDREGILEQEDKPRRRR